MSIERTRKIFSNADLDIHAVERVDFSYKKSRRGGRLFGSMETVAVIVRTQNEIYALDVHGNPIDAEQLLK